MPSPSHLLLFRHLCNAVNKSRPLHPARGKGEGLGGWLQSEGEREETSGISTSCPWWLIGVALCCRAAQQSSTFDVWDEEIRWPDEKTEHLNQGWNKKGRLPASCAQMIKILLPASFPYSPLFSAWRGTSNGFPWHVLIICFYSISTWK